MDERMNIKTPLAVIIAGGKSSRMGRDKALLPVGGKPMAQLLVDRFRADGFAVALSVARKGQFPIEGAAELTDAFPGMGPLNGIVAAFSETDAQQILLVAADMPKAAPALARRLEALRGDCDACVIRREDGTVETLFGIYTRACCAEALRCLESGRRSIRAVLDSVRVRYVTESELPGWPLADILSNLNTPEDYARFHAQEQ